MLAYSNVRHIIRRHTTMIRRSLDQQLTTMTLTRIAYFDILLYSMQSVTTIIEMHISSITRELPRKINRPFFL
jgi:hypothetical protein